PPAEASVLPRSSRRDRTQSLPGYAERQPQNSIDRASSSFSPGPCLEAPRTSAQRHQGTFVRRVTWPDGRFKRVYHLERACLSDSADAWHQTMDRPAVRGQVVPHVAKSARRVLESPSDVGSSWHESVASARQPSS